MGIDTPQMHEGGVIQGRVAAPSVQGGQRGEYKKRTEGGKRARGNDSRGNCKDRVWDVKILL